MKVLWITNIPPQGLESRLMPRHFGGSWLTGALDGLLRVRDTRLGVAFPTAAHREFDGAGGAEDRPAVLGLPANRRANLEPGRGLDSRLDEILGRLDPDLVHIHGTEMPHAWASIRHLRDRGVPFVVSLQGVLSELARTYLSGLPLEALRTRTVRDLLRHDSLIAQQRNLRRRGELESDAIRAGSHFIGRTTWDRAVLADLHPGATYHHCAETLRSSFYSGTWEPNTIGGEIILMSQGSYPIKGLHVVLEALWFLRARRPNVRLLVAGPDPVGGATFSSRVRRAGYGKYISSCIHRWHLEDAVQFLGVLDEAQMRQALLNASVFLTASSMENESNSLSEAKALAVPVVASFVGGVASRIEHGVDGFHYHDASPHMLSFFLEQILSDAASARRMGLEAQRRQLRISNREKNAMRLLEIYETLLTDPRGVSTK